MCAASYLASSTRPQDIARLTSSGGGPGRRPAGVNGGKPFVGGLDAATREFGDIVVQRLLAEIRRQRFRNGVGIGKGLRRTLAWLTGRARQSGRARAAGPLRTNFRDLRDIIVMPGVGHEPPEERPEEINAIVLKFLRDIIGLRHLQTQSPVLSERGRPQDPERP
jgi:pimeloyl-ACP methyl ester carboxylesterase